MDTVHMDTSILEHHSSSVAGRAVLDTFPWQSLKSAAWTIDDKIFFILSVCFSFSRYQTATNEYITAAFLVQSQKYTYSCYCCLQEDDTDLPQARQWQRAGSSRLSTRIPASHKSFSLISPYLYIFYSLLKTELENDKQNMISKKGTRTRHDRFSGVTWTRMELNLRSHLLLQGQKSPSYPLTNWWKTSLLPSLSKYTSLTTFAFCSFPPSEAFPSALKRHPMKSQSRRIMPVAGHKYFLTSEPKRAAHAESQ